MISDKYVGAFKLELQTTIADALAEVKEIELSPYSFTFYTSVAVISSSRIEGEQMEMDSYLKHKMQHIEYMPELVEKPNDLFQAYLFAKENTLTRESFIQSHVLLSKHLLPEKWRGVYRKNEMLVMEHQTGNIQFEAAHFKMVASEMDKLWDDIAILLEKDLSIEEIFYYASFIHAAFVSIHPFNDGNGRAGRLLEKWFLSQKLGEVAWYIQSEKYYYHHVNEYYKNLQRIGMFYDKIDYEKASQFFQMLPHAISYKG